MLEVNRVCLTSVTAWQTCLNFYALKPLTSGFCYILIFSGAAVCQTLKQDWRQTAGKEHTTTTTDSHTHALARTHTCAHTQAPVTDWWPAGCKSLSPTEQWDWLQDPWPWVGWADKKMTVRHKGDAWQAHTHTHSTWRKGISEPGTGIRLSSAWLCLKTGTTQDLSECRTPQDYASAPKTRLCQFIGATEVPAISWVRISSWALCSLSIFLVVFSAALVLPRACRVASRVKSIKAAWSPELCQDCQAPTCVGC